MSAQESEYNKLLDHATEIDISIRRLKKSLDTPAIELENTKELLATMKLQGYTNKAPKYVATGVFYNASPAIPTSYNTFVPYFRHFPQVVPKPVSNLGTPQISDIWGFTVKDVEIEESHTSSTETPLQTIPPTSLPSPNETSEINSDELEFSD